MSALPVLSATRLFEGLASHRSFEEEFYGPLAVVC